MAKRRAIKSSNIVIIPARGGSKRLPGKNLASLAGMPLIEYSINYAQVNQEIVDNIIVSTDNPSIEEVAEQKGVKVVRRPPHLALDTSTTVSALRHVLESINYEVEDVILLQPTNPLRPAKLLSEAYQKFKLGNYDSLLTVSPNTRKLGKIEDGRFVPFNYTIGQRSQDLEPLYHENGLLYISKASIIKKERLLGEKNLPFIVDHPFADIDIDYKQDLEYAEFLLRKNLND